MAPVILALKADPRFSPVLISSGQHGEMLTQALSMFDLFPDFNLEVMEPGQSLAILTAKVTSRVDKVLSEIKPDIVLVHGDTTTAFASSVAAFYLGIDVGHVEAGLRTGNVNRPFPEEFNRQAISRIARWNFAPTDTARINLLAEAVKPETIHLIGNTVVDALNLVVGRMQDDHRLNALVKTSLEQLVDFDYESTQFVLITAHRRENLDGGIDHICQAIAHLAQHNPDTHFIFPVHLNPLVQEISNKYLADRANVSLTQPLNYLQFLTLLAKSVLVISDSGGIQEEGVSLNKRVLVTRHETERGEGIASGHLTLVGTDRDAIIREATKAIKDSSDPDKKDSLHNPYGDGLSSTRIIDILGNYEK